VYGEVRERGPRLARARLTLPLRLATVRRGNDPMNKPIRPSEIQTALLDWYDRNRRNLPWRQSDDPYAIWISEILLQQTRVETVIPYYLRFLAAFPTVEALATANDDDVRGLWSGLGYYRRASSMLNAARLVVKECGGTLPSSAEGLRKLPGFGPYTAGAVASIAFGEAVPAVDGNVERVLARILGLTRPVKHPATNREIWATASQLAQCSRPGDLNQALIELGATTCKPRPLCGACPVRTSCHAREAGLTETIPAPAERRPKKEMALTLLALNRRSPSRILLEKQKEKGLFSGLWCLPMLEGLLDIDAVADEAERHFGFELIDLKSLGAFTHVLTHRLLRVRVVAAVTEAKPTETQKYVSEKEIRSLGVPTLTTKALALSPDCAPWLAGVTQRARPKSPNESLQLLLPER
jgi:A/G-specific adenine glycosylase